EGQPVRAGAVPVYARRLREPAQLRGDGALPGRRARPDDRIPLLRLRRADARGAGRLRRDLRDRAQPVLVRHLAQPDPAGVRRRLRRAGRAARRGDHRARPLARQDPRTAQDRRGVRAARLRQRGPAHRRLPGRAQLRREPERVPARGRDPNPYRLASLQVVAVSETDERAEQEYARHLEAHYRSGLGAIPHTAMAVPGYAEPAAIEGMLRSTGPAGMLSRMKTATYKEIVDSQVAIVGSPATVADQIEAFVREFRIGNLMVMLQNGSMPRDLTEKNISLFAEEVLPRLRPVWDADGWENHWWPTAAGAVGAAGAA